MAAVTLMYHDVVTPGRADESGFAGVGPGSYKVDWPTFVAHLDALEQAGLGPGGPVPEERMVRLTFDDGGACSLAVAHMLADRGWVGHFFVPTDLIGAAGFASAEDVRVMADELGQVVGSHSHTHPARISGLGADAILAEWTRSVQALGEIVSTRVTAGSVPGGYTSAAVERAAAAAGLCTLFVSRPTARARAAGTCTVLGRYAIRRSTAADEVLALATGHGTARSRQAVAWAARSAPKRVLGDAYPRIRHALQRRRGT